MIFDIDTWHPGLAFAFIVVPFVIALSGLAIGAYTTYRNLDVNRPGFRGGLNS